MAMTEEHKQTLKRLRKMFVENLEIKPVLDALISNDVLSYEDEDRITARDSTEDKIRELLRLLPRKGDKAFWALHEALEDKQWLQEKMIYRHRVGLPVGDCRMQTDTDKLDDSTETVHEDRMQTESHTPAVLTSTAQEIRAVVPDFCGLYQHWSILHTSPQVVSEYTVEQIYDMKSHQNGRAYILHNFCYTGSPHLYERQHADIDTTNLIHLVSELGYEAEVHRNLSAQEIKSSLDAFIGSFEDTHRSAIVAILGMGGVSNGSQFVLGSDGTAVALKEEIYNTLCGCHSLEKKPKLFFIQICKPRGLFECGFNECEVKPHLDKERNPDSYVAYVCTKGHYSHRSPIPGSWFVQLLCEVLLEEGHKTEFDDMMQMVADTVGRCNRFYDFQTCQIVEDNEHVFRDTSLEKELYFLPHSAPTRSLKSHSSDVCLPQWFLEK